jgi:hypothetical protein
MPKHEVLSRDGVPLKKGMEVLEVWEGYFGWSYVSNASIVRVSKQSPSVLVYGDIKHWVEQSGSIGIYVDPVKAVAEMRRRNKLTAKGVKRG